MVANALQVIANAPQVIVNASQTTTGGAFEVANALQVDGNAPQVIANAPPFAKKFSPLAAIITSEAACGAEAACFSDWSPARAYKRPSTAYTTTANWREPNQRLSYLTTFSQEP